MANPLPKIFITGAGGYFGSELAKTYSRAGYKVYGLVRSSEKAKKLAIGEVLPVLGDLTDSEGKWVDELKKCQIVIHCASDMKNFEKVDGTAVKTIISALSTTGSPRNPALFVYTSGGLVYKSIQWPGDEPITDDSPLVEDGPPFLKARIRHEKIVLNAYKETNGSVAGIVARPAYIYGKESDSLLDYFAKAMEGGNDVAIKSFRFFRNEPILYSSTIHVDDLCDGYLKLTSHPIEQTHSRPFIFCAPGQEFYPMQAAERFMRAAGYTGSIRYEPEPEGYPPISSRKSVVCIPVNAQKLLGWTPQHQPLFDQIDVLFANWKAKNNMGTWD